MIKRIYRRYYASLLVCAFTVSLLNTNSFAQQQNTRSPDEVSRITREVSQEVLSPYCPGKTLAMCPSGNAAEARRNIQEMASQGTPKAEIIERLIDQYGEEYRMVEPPAQDMLKLISAIVIGFILAVVALFVFTRRKSGSEVVGNQDDFDGELETESDENDLYLAEIRQEYLD